MLLDHLITHSKERPFRWPTRNAPKEDSTFVHHKKTHNGETSHVCKECGKAFSQLKTEDTSESSYWKNASQLQ
ncbi:zinc finger protein 584 [Prionailurus iriomotensis]